MSKRVAVYARVSTTRQAENDISIPDQLAHAKRYCAERKWTAIHEYVDAGASARDDNRPELQAMLTAACVDPSPFDIVLYHSQSRFFRDVAGYTFWKRKLQKHGVALVSMTQEFGEGPAADFAETVLAAADALHSEETAKHVRRTMIVNAQQGFWNGSSPPFGYRTVEAEQRGQKIKKRLEVDEKQAATVRLIFELFLKGDGTSGALGIKDIASWLNARGFRNGRAGPFYTSAVHAILTRQTYTGLYQYNCHESRTRRERPRDEWVAVQVPQIIPENDFRLTQARLHERRPSVTPPRITKSDVLLTGILHCASCGGAMMLRTGKSGRYRYYTCSNRVLKGSTACTDPITVPMAELDERVLEALAEQLLTPGRLIELLRQVQRHQHKTASENIRHRASLAAGLRRAETGIRRYIKRWPLARSGTRPCFGKP